MNCRHLATFNRRIRVGRESARAGQCKMARHLLKKAARDLKAATTGNRSMTGNPCLRALAKGADEMLAAGRVDLRRHCR